LWALNANITEPRRRKVEREEHALPALAKCSKPTTSMGNDEALQGDGPNSANNPFDDAVLSAMAAGNGVEKRYDSASTPTPHGSTNTLKQSPHPHHATLSKPTRSPTLLPLAPLSWTIHSSPGPSLTRAPMLALWIRTMSHYGGQHPLYPYQSAPGTGNSSALSWARMAGWGIKTQPHTQPCLRGFRMM
jgi:hypothetical protein